MRDRPLSPHLQVYRWEVSMTLSILHRVSGMFLALGTVVLVWWLMAVAAGDAAYERFVACIDTPIGYLLMFGWSAALMLHLLNGIRHLAWDAGWGFELARAKATGWVVVIGAVVLTALIWFFARGGAA